MAIKFSNYASSLLTAAIAAGDTSASVVSTATFPSLSAGDYFYAVLTDANDAAHEVIKVTAISSLTFTIARGLDGTTAQAWPAGTKIEMRWNAAAVADLDAAAVHKAGVETMTALKTFTVGVSIGSASGGDLRPHSTRGLQLSGLAGSYYDLSLLNPAGIAYYMRVPTGKNIPVFPQGISLSDTLPWSLMVTPTAGTVLRGTTGTTYDFGLVDAANSSYCMCVPTGENTPNFPNGINLGGTANLSAYDEGTWTPTATNLGGSNITYSTKWVKVGNRVDFTVTVSGTGLTATSNSTKLSIPFTASRNSIAAILCAGITQPGGALVYTDGFVYPSTVTSTTRLDISGTIFLN